MGDTSSTVPITGRTAADPRAAASPLPARPVPVGAFPLPFGFLLLPPGEEIEPVRGDLLAGRLPKQWPDGTGGLQAVLADDLDTARAAFAGTDPVSRFNRFVLDPDAVDADALRDSLGPEIGVLVDLVQFAAGRCDLAPDPDGHSGEIKALLLAAVAVEGLGAPPDPPRFNPNGSAPSPARPADLLKSAIEEARPVSPALAGVLHGALAQACKHEGDSAGAVTALEAGIALLADTDLAVARAEQYLELAATFHELAAADSSGTMASGLLNQAVRHYHNALAAVSADSASKDSASKDSASKDSTTEVWAAAHAGLGAAYLTMPMSEVSDQLRLGVAVGSLRAALCVYTRATHPAQWSSVQLNLANALVYAPSKHQGDNLTEAVELYEAVLSARSRDSDPVGYARALANQGNALAHLGMFDHARAKLTEARFLFEEAQEWDATASVRGLLNELTRNQKAASSREDDPPSPTAKPEVPADA